MASSKAAENGFVKRKYESAAPFWHGIIQNAEFEFNIIIFLNVQDDCRPN